MGRDFEKRDRETLDRIRRAAADPTGVEQLALVLTTMEGRECTALCVLTRDALADVCRLQPVAIILEPSEAMKLTNPATGLPGLPWSDPEPNQIKIEGVD